MTTQVSSALPDPRHKPLTWGRRSWLGDATVWLFVIGPSLALLGSVPLAVLTGWLPWSDVLVGLVIGAIFYVVTMLGVTVGFHRHFTHGAFKASPWMRVVLAITGQLAVQGGVCHWVADHRRHHAYSDKAGDPHSPWLHGESPWGVLRGLFHAHMGWLFESRLTNEQRFIPDLLAQRHLVVVNRLFWLCTLVSIFLPPLLGFLLTGTWQGALSGFVWGTLVRMAVSQHVTWSTNSICHMYGNRPFRQKGVDRSTNFWPLAVLSMGESWHNLHHSDPTCARHGVLPGQVDISARLIWLLEKFRLVHDVRWPTSARIERLRGGVPAGN